MLNYIISVHSTKIIQDIIKYIDFDSKIFIIKVIYSHFTTLVKDLNGIYSIVNSIAEIEDILAENKNSSKSFELNIKQSTILKFFLHKFHKKVIKNIYEISIDKYGCCFLQKYMDIISKEKVIEIINIVFPYTKEFLTEKFANYIIQYIISKNYYCLNKIIVKIFLEDLEFYCTSNVSSNVLEIFLDNNNYCDKLIEKLLLDESRDILKNILLNPYGNYGKNLFLFLLISFLFYGEIQKWKICNKTFIRVL